MLPVLISDHAPMFCAVTAFIDHPKAHRWRFKDSLLSNDDFISQTKTQLGEFEEHNGGSGDNHQT